MVELTEVLAAIRFAVKRGNRDEALEHLERADVIVAGLRAPPAAPSAPAPVDAAPAEPPAPPVQ